MSCVVEVRVDERKHLILTLETAALFLVQSIKEESTDLALQPNIVGLMMDSLEKKVSRLMKQNQRNRCCYSTNSSSLSKPATYIIRNATPLLW